MKIFGGVVCLLCDSHGGDRVKRWQRKCLIAEQLAQSRPDTPAITKLWVRSISRSERLKENLVGDLGVSNRPRFKSQTKEPSTALARLTDNAPGIARKVAGAAVAVDSVLDRVPLIPYEAPKAPTRGERIAAGAMAVVYTAGGGLSIIPLVGPWTASAIIAAGGAAARVLSPNPEVQNQGNLALQTTGYSAAVTLLDFGLLGFGSVPYFRAAAKSALVAVRG